MNVYNTLQGCKKAEEAIKLIIQAPNFMQKRSLVLEDVNLYHTDWNNQTTNPSKRVTSLAEWVAGQGAFY